MAKRMKFSHGVHPPELKELTEGVRVRRLPFPDEVVLPLSQHTGKPARPIVRVGDRVERGDMVAEADGFVSSPVHASAAGTVVAIELWPHPSGTFQEAIRIAVAPYHAQVPRKRIIPDWHGLSPEQIVEAVRHAGVVGLGGAAFPTHVKLVPPKDTTIDTIVINGCECEPYLTTDHRTMVEYPDRVHLGTRLMMTTLGVDRAMIGVENNKPDAIERLQATIPEDLRDRVTVHGLTVKYPQGAEKMLIKAVTGREVPSGKLPASVGALVQNVVTTANVARIFETGQPLIERIMTISGRGIRKPGNWVIPFGTKLRDVIDACGGLTEDAAEIVFGGPMMGQSQATLDVPVLKATGGILILSRDECKQQDILPCIRCGKCVEACPVFLNPQLLGALARVERFEEMVKEADLGDCMLCGCCSYVCPSNIPLSQMFAMSKFQLSRLARK
jgi:electron transport complex protein RnfC